MDYSKESRLMIIITTTETKEDADRIARHLVGLRLVACAQVNGPITSHYWWKGTLEEATEWECKLKALASNYEAIEQELTAIHPYEIPQIVALPVQEVAGPFREWIKEVTSSVS